MTLLNAALLKQLWLTLGASLAFLVIGMVRGYSSSALPSMELTDPHLVSNSERKSWIGAIPPLGAFAGSLVAGWLMQRAGRRRTLQLAAPLWGAAWLLLGAARSLPVVLLARLLCGVGVGLVLAPAQVYVSECCDPAVRGRLGSLPALCMSLGILLTYVAGKWLCWRYLAFFCSSFAGALFVIMLPLPESPVWLKSRGLDYTQAVEWLHLSNRATALASNGNTSDPKKQEEPAESLFSREVLFSPAVGKPLVIGFSLLIFQQYSGIDAVIFFTVEIFETAGSTLDPVTATIIVGAVQLVSNAASTLLVDKAGRRPLLMLSAAFMTLSMSAMGAAFYLEYDNDSFIGYLPVVSLVVFMLGFSLGFGGLPFLLLGELFPARHRSQLSAAASATNLLTMFSVIKSYHALEAMLTSAGTFWMYACFCALAFFFVLFMVPETKGKSLAEIEQYFRGKNGEEIEKDIPMDTKF